MGETAPGYDAETGWLRPDPTTGRYYDPATGRWVCEDPVGFTAGDPNLARYVGNDPINRTDPSGLQAVAAPPPPAVGPAVGPAGNPVIQFPADTGTGLPRPGFSPRPPSGRPSDDPDVQYWIGQARDAGVPNSEIEAILSRSYLGMPGSGSWQEYVIRDLRRAIKAHEPKTEADILRKWCKKLGVKVDEKRDKECRDAYDKDVETCKEHYSDRRDRAACYERAANRLARCLAGEEPRPKLIPERR